MRRLTALEKLDLLPTMEMETEPDLITEWEEVQQYRSTNAKRNPYRNRKFLAIDGEGIGKSPHFYVLLGASDGESSADISSESLSTYECLEFLIKMECKYPDHIKVGFSINYDIAMITKDFTDKQLARMMKGDTVLHCGFRVRCLKGKWLDIFKGGVSTRIFDVFSFFGCSFIKASEDYIGTHPLYLEIAESVEEGKDKRGSFTYDQLETLIRPYMHKELELLVLLMTKLREYLASINLHVSSWHGPGAVASKLLSQHKIKKYRPEEDHVYVRTASQYAYAGGRFEGFKMGLFYGDVYSYDLRSAYPYALTQVPALDGEFYSSDDITDVPDFSLCRVSYYNLTTDRTAINPLALRSNSGSIFYPGAVDTWIWGCEYKAAKKWFGDKIECSEVIRFSDSGIRPFDFVHDLYEQRMTFKHAHNPVQLVCKLGMNSLYGKLAQRVGWNKKTNMAPHHHQLRIAGFATAMCRASVLDAMMQAPDSIIAVETDGIYSEKPLMLDIGKNLGQWDEQQYSGMLFMQSGVYYTLDKLDYDTALGYDEWSAGKTRGFTANKTNIKVAMKTVNDLAPVKIVQKRFNGLPGGIGRDVFRTWTDEPRTLKWGGGGKRYHSPENCSGCSHNELWHQTVWTPTTSPISHKHSLPWTEIAA